MKAFWHFSKRYLLRYKWWYITGFLAIAVTQALSVGIIEITRIAIDQLASPLQDADSVIRLVAIMAGMALALVLIRITSRLLVFTPGRLIEYNIRNDYYQRLLALPRTFFSDREAGDLVSRCTNDIGFVRAAYGFAALQVANVAVTMVFGLGAMMRMNLKVTTFLAIPMVLSFTLIQGGIAILFKHWRRANAQVGEMSAFCLASYKGISALQSFCAEGAFSQTFAHHNQDYLATNLIITRIRTFMMPLIQSVGNLSIFLILWFVGPQVISGNMSLGQVMAFLGYIGMVMPPLLSLGWMLNVLQRSLPAVERLDEILLAPEADIPPPSSRMSLPSKPLHLTVRGLNHTYPTPKERFGRAFSLRNIHLDLPPGKVLGIVGPVGSGKTTLVECLLRMNPLESGCVFLDDRDATKIPLETYRSHWSPAPQRAFLFSASLRDNLTAACPPDRRPPDDAQLMDALDKACFDMDPELFPKGLETEVGEKGIMLSGGQRQRIALARALLKPALIYVLDDVLSAVDHETEQRIIHNLTAFARSRSVIIVSHRISAVQWADEIVVLEQGHLTYRGTHSELVKQAGYYRDIFQAQDRREGAAHE